MVKPIYCARSDQYKITVGIIIIIVNLIAKESEFIDLHGMPNLLLPNDPY